MTGIIDHTDARVPHTCRRPAIHTFDGNLRRTLHHPEGSRYLCDCGLVWVVWHRPTTRSPHVVIVGRLEWRLETRRERRRRLGLPWWRR